jgi:ribosomal protein L12E/L44/L45/RPP1/RPP2
MIFMVKNLSGLNIRQALAQGETPPAAAARQPYSARPRRETSLTAKPVATREGPAVSTK